MLRSDFNSHFCNHQLTLNIDRLSDLFMLRFTFILLVLVSVLGSYGQQTQNQEYIVTQENDTLFGKIKRVNFFNAQSLKIDAGSNKKRLNIKKIKSFHVGQTTFENPSIRRKGKQRFLGYFMIPHITDGNIALYEKKKKPVFIKANKVFRLNQLKYYADDFLKMDHFLTHNKENVDSLMVFIEEYNDFREKFPFNKSFAEKNLHKKDFFNPQVAINFLTIFPHYAYVGAELGLSKDFVVIPRLSGILVPTRDDNVKVQPTAELGLRYYFLDTRNIKNEVVTYKNSGAYFSSFYSVPLIPDFEFHQNLRLVVGHKQVAYNGLYLDFSVGAIHRLRRDEIGFWFNTGLGFVF